MKLLFVIPALNEEQSIESIIQRSLNACENIIKNSSVTEVRIVVVSDGSTDNTVAIAQKYTNKIGLVVFEKNRGYGAAIKAGWDSEEADLLGFLDADGTCDPLFFVDLCNIITQSGADVALGNRLNKDSQMPFVRRLGNTMFSVLLSLASNKRVKDTASGMRVIRKTALKQILPLPDGLNFTPAMSARVILGKSFKIVEKDMPYQEREGESKLHIWKDGKRFLFAILENIFLYIPYRIYSLLGILMLFFAVIVIWPYGQFYIKNSFLEDWMIYRFIVSTVASLMGILLLCISNFTHNIVHFTLQPEVKRKKSLYYYIFEHWLAIALGVLFYAAGTLLIYRSLFVRFTTGHTNEHWSRYIAMIFFYVSGTIFIFSYFTNRIMGLIRERVAYLQSVADGSK